MHYRRVKKKVKSKKKGLATNSVIFLEQQNFFFLNFTHFHHCMQYRLLEQPTGR